jgi:membrane-bound lytic murein transglycosylase B
MPPAVRTRVARDVPTRREGCGAIRALSEPRALADWSSRGVRAQDASELPRVGVAASLITLGTRSFLVYGNYETILRYNCSHRYALSVSLLADLLPSSPSRPTVVPTGTWGPHPVRD